MPLYTFSSRWSLKTWLTVWAGTLVLTLSAVLGYNHYWSSQGYIASVRDSMQFWAVHRSAVYLRATKPLVFLGASRTLYGIDINWIYKNLPSYRPVMLAVNGRYPLAALRDLADDNRFSGVVLVDIDSRGLNKNNHEMLQPYIDYYNEKFTPNNWLHYYLLSKFQQRFVFLDREFSLYNTLRYLTTSDGWPRKPNFRMDTARNSDLDLKSVDALALADWFAQLVEEDMLLNLPPEPEQWLSDLSKIKGWVEKIEKRGGQVVFYTPPVSGRQRALDQAYYPREKYWDKLESQYEFSTLVATDIPLIKEIELPDESHMHFIDKQRYTRELIGAMQERFGL